ncbi:hypothetical protein JJB07_14625 [Tumebacillus sp. ITR2]|uniref:Uncharacterized protein n=1 Tax=Tumebacillus amylolyticus TaxID=2801339 RepID=A0ABS1JC82_9BACL|nr:hypothetical protein [Tumebacillus amylolyticus]MBL0387873.1 hypothetical protein [Tumebacillus amylolyticus]
MIMTRLPMMYDRDLSKLLGQTPPPLNFAKRDPWWCPKMNCASNEDGVCQLYYADEMPAGAQPDDCLDYRPDEEKCENCGGDLIVTRDLYASDLDGRRGVMRDVKTCTSCWDVAGP